MTLEFYKAIFDFHPRDTRQSAADTINRLNALATQVGRREVRLPYPLYEVKFEHDGHISEVSVRVPFKDEDTLSATSVAIGRVIGEAYERGGSRQRKPYRIGDAPPWQTQGWSKSGLEHVVREIRRPERPGEYRHLILKRTFDPGAAAASTRSLADLFR